MFTPVCLLQYCRLTTTRVQSTNVDHYAQENVTYEELVRTVSNARSTIHGNTITQYLTKYSG